MTDNEKAKELAERFHATYELLAPQFGYETREETREFDAESPNGKLMIAVCQSIIDAGYEARTVPADEEVRASRLDAPSAGGDCAECGEGNMLTETPHAPTCSLYHVEVPRVDGSTLTDAVRRLRRMSDDINIAAYDREACRTLIAAVSDARRIARGNRKTPPGYILDCQTDEECYFPNCYCPIRLAAVSGDGWVSVEDRLPDDTPNPWPVQVLVHITMGGIDFYQTAKFYKGEWTDDNGDLIQSPAIVRAWMLIPKRDSPKGDEQKETK